ncbi:MAG: pantetheine-phosphate adenylyltransferase, partial [Mailhella sp.]
KGAIAIVRGLRAISDFDYEFQMALMNRKLSPSIQTIFLMADFHLMYVSSTNLKTVASLGGNVADLTPANVWNALCQKYQQKNYE